MDYEKKYKETIAWIDIIMPTLTKEQQEDALENFPELAESEDEKIRKECISIINAWAEACRVEGDCCEVAPICIAWLEKQGENANFQNKIQVDNQVTRNYDNVPANLSQLKQAAEYVDEVKPEFHEGDWVVTDKNDRVQIKAVNNSYYTIDNGMYFNIPYVDKYWHLWTIQDAKDGDVLVIQKTDVTYESIFIFKKIESNRIIQYLHYFTTDADEEVCEARSIDGFIGFVGTNVHPATKEQRELLFQKMKEAGYAFDFEKKELKKIEDEIEIPFGAKDSELQEETYFIPKVFHAEIEADKVVIKKGEKPAAWSEEDELRFNCTVGYLNRMNDANGGIFLEDINWLKSLKGRIGG